jgi:pyrroloquinoline quinone biosynthesis protein B
MRARRGEAPLRTQSSIAISGDGIRWLLVNASVDLPRQFAQTPALWPRTLRENPFAGVLLTDANVDHCAGLGELRQNPGPLTIVSSAVTKSLLAGERAYERFARPPHRWITEAPVVVETLENLEIRTIEVPGLLPGYAGRTVAPGAVVAYIVRDAISEVQTVVAPVFSEIDDRLYDAIASSDVALLDGTFYSADELRVYGLMSKDARGLGHAPVGGDGGTLARISGLSNRRIFVHINNSNPMLDPSSDALRAVKAAGCEIAEDGMLIDVTARSLANP